MIIDSSTASITNTRFSGTALTGAGDAAGCLAGTNSRIDVVSSVFNRFSLDGAGTFGGAIYAERCTLTVDSSVFDTLNFSGISEGGGIYAVNSLVGISHSSFSNTVLSSMDPCGAVHCLHSALTMDNCSIGNITFANDGMNGALLLHHSPATIRNSHIGPTFPSTINHITYAVYIDSSNTVMNNVTIADGRQKSSNENIGTGIYCANASIELNNSIIRGFSAYSLDHNDYTWDKDSTHVVTIRNSIVDLDTGSIHIPGEKVQRVFESVLRQNPLFVDSAAGDFHLAAGSPGINAGGLDTAGLGLFPFDLDGNPRIFSVSETRIDMGAFEYQSPTAIALLTPAQPAAGFVLRLDARAIRVSLDLGPGIHDLSLCRLDGRRVLSVSAGSDAMGRASFFVERSGIAAGMYSMVIRSEGGGVVSRKLILD